jgi:hypothetical protein
MSMNRETKQFLKRKRPRATPPFWIRFRKSCGPHSKSRQWIYTFWQASSKQADQFARQVVGRYRDYEVLTAERPRNLCEQPAQAHGSQVLYLEQF